MLTNRADERKLTDEKEEKIVGELDSGGLERDEMTNTQPSMSPTFRSSRRTARGPTRSR